jgi:flagellar hook assembly protein FlgD
METKIQFSIDANIQVDLDVFDIMGRKVRSLIVGEVIQSGMHQFKWDGRDDDGRIQPSGSYIFRLSTPYHSINKTCILVK